MIYTAVPQPDFHILKFPKEGGGEEGKEGERERRGIEQLNCLYMDLFFFSNFLLVKSIHSYLFVAGIKN